MYIQYSEDLRGRLAQAVAKHPVGVSPRARWLGKTTPPPNTGVLTDETDEKDLYQTVQVQEVGDDGQIQSAHTITLYSEGSFKKMAPDAHLCFTPDGVVITETLAEKDYLVFARDSMISWRARIDADGVEAEIYSPNIIQAWNNRLAVKTRYNSEGNLTVCSLHPGNSQPINLLPCFSSEAMLRLQEGRGTGSEATPQKEIDSPIIVPVGSYLILAVHLGIIRNSEKLPPPIAFEYTLRFCRYPSDGGYSPYYQRVFTDVGIAPHLYPSLPEIARRGYLDVAHFLPGYRLDPPSQVSEPYT